MKLFIFACLCIALSGCNSSRITTNWRSPMLPQERYDNILVLGLIPTEDLSIREKMENRFVNDLREHGITAVSAFKEFGPEAFHGLDEATIVKKLSNLGIDGIITIVLKDQAEESKFVPTSTNIPVADDYGARFYDYSKKQEMRVRQPGYYIVKSRYLWQTNFYDLATQKLLYMAQTKTFDPANTESMSHEYGWMIVKDMLKQKVIEDRTGSGKF